jgi:mannose-6-phosphate isomerase-like protein (cupin superfamily)
LSKDDTNKLQKLITDWQTFYKDNDYRTLMANIKPFVDGCGSIHDLKDASIFRTRQHETGCIVDMTKVIGATEPHFHRKATEVYFILQGTGIVVVGDHEYQIKPGDSVYVPKFLGHYTVPTNDLVLGVVNIPYFDKEDLIDLRIADDTLRKEVNYNHKRYLHYAHQ